MGMKFAFALSHRSFISHTFTLYLGIFMNSVTVEKTIQKLSVISFDNSFNYSRFTLLLLERVICSIALLLISPLFAVVALLIKLTSEGDVFYSQKRIGKGGLPFNIIKFRTMVKNAEANTGAILAMSEDSRVTVLGNLLRKTHLDELPQLINIVKGQMSLIGPRPERPIFVEQFEKNIPGYQERHLVLPGITGLAQVVLPYDATAREKLIFDLYYIKNHNSLQLNLLILLNTVKKVLLFSNFQGIPSFQETILRTIR